METLTLPQPVKGRPRQFDIDEALGAALRVFWQRGFEGASLTELTEAMGITRPSLYAAFGNKESLFRKALDLYEREKLAYMQTALDAPTARGVAERLLRGGLAMQTSGCDPRGCMSVISSVACTPHAESIRNEIIDRRASAMRALIERLARAKAEGELADAVDPDGLARYLIAVLQGLSVQAAAGADVEQLTQLVDTTLAIWPTR